MDKQNSKNIKVQTREYNNMELGEISDKIDNYKNSSIFNEFGIINAKFINQV